MSDHPPQSQFRDWLRVWLLSGCQFAARFGGSADKLLFYELIGDIQAVDTREIASFLDRAGAARRVAVLLGPDVRSDDDLAKLLQALALHPRWNVQSKAALARDSREVGVSMSWRTDTGATTHAMGFAPSAYMPVSRRAPYLALAAWTGGHANPNRTQTNPDHSSLGDAPPPEGDYESMRHRTQERSRQLRDLDAISLRDLRQLAFRLDRRAVEREFPALLRCG